jgi:fatty acid desaturase
MQSATVAHVSSDAREGKPQNLNAEIKALSARDNWTNWYYVGQIWVVVALTVLACSWAQSELSSHGYHWAWQIPVVLFGVIVVGASQHGLGGVLHEATHFMLFSNRKLNDLAADWLAGFPLYTSIHHYRLYHLAHHQFINDPERDPDLVQLQMSGHALDFPMTHMEILGKVLRLLWLPNLVRYTVSRAKSHSFDSAHNPYFSSEGKESKWPTIVNVLFWLAVPTVVGAVMRSNDGTAFAILAASWAAAVLYFSIIPESSYSQSRLKPTISHRATAISRVTFLAILYTALVASHAATGSDALWRAWNIYWLIPLFTTFPLFMIMRHWVHHGNADRGRYTNTRVYLVNPLIRYAIFPFGFEYHLPHHVYASVPHFRLKKLHDLLQNDPEYVEKCVVVEGYFGHDHPESGRPTAMSVLGSKHAPKQGEKAFLDSSVLDSVEVVERDKITAEESASASSAMRAG